MTCGSMCFAPAGAERSFPLLEKEVKAGRPPLDGTPAEKAGVFLY